ncbi:MAG: (2Fe-2S) ferredoxin domain-containing protein [Anaerolineae bacterium]|nr:(2Fe-2S) ferredoxin domain-containing protein [Anaerolineae bacterium]
MVTVVICVGSSCYVRGSDKVADIFEALIEKERLQDQVELMGAFCMEKCSMGVSVRIDEQVYHSVSVQDAEAFFYDEIMSRIRVTV